MIRSYLLWPFKMQHTSGAPEEQHNIHISHTNAHTYPIKHEAWTPLIFGTTTQPGWDKLSCKPDCGKDDTTTLISWAPPALLLDITLETKPTAHR